MKSEPHSDAASTGGLVGQAAFSTELFRDAAAAGYRDHVNRNKTPSLKGAERSGNVGHFLCVALNSASFKLDPSRNRVQIRGQGIVLVPAVGDRRTGIEEVKLFEGRCCVASFKYSRKWVVAAVASGVPIFAYLFVLRAGVIYHEVGRIKSVDADGNITAWYEDQHAVLEAVDLGSGAENARHSTTGDVVDDSGAIEDAPDVAVPVRRIDDDDDDVDDAPPVAIPLKPRR